MNLFAYTAPAIFAGGIVHFFISMVVIILFASLAYYAITQFVPDPSLAKLLRFVVFAMAIIFVVLLLLGITGCVTNPITGKKSLDPNVQNQLVAIASSEIHGIANSYLTTGKVDFKKDLISGALSQVYTLESTATPATQASVGAAVGTVITDPGLKAAVTSAAVNTINAVPAGTAKPAAINGALGALDLALQKVTVTSP